MENSCVCPKFEQHPWKDYQHNKQRSRHLLYLCYGTKKKKKKENLTNSVPFCSLIAFPNTGLFLHSKPVEAAPCVDVSLCKNMSSCTFSYWRPQCSPPAKPTARWKNTRTSASISHLVYALNERLTQLSPIYHFTSCQKDAAASNGHLN